MRARRVLLLPGILVLGVALRGLYLLTPDLNSDMAIVGLMARHILQGEFPIFYWGQSFGGTFEAHLAALLFYLFGPSRLTLALSPFLFSVAFLVLTYRLAREAFDREVGLLALLLAALPASFLVSHSVMTWGHYMSNVTLGSLVLLLALRLARDPGPDRRRPLFLLGFVAGLGWYASLQSVHYLLAAGVFLLAREPRLLCQKASWVVPPAFLLGSLPLWVYNLRNPSASTVLAVYSHGGTGELADSLVRYMAYKLPSVLGAPIAGDRMDVARAILVLGLYALAFLHCARGWRSRGGQLILLFLVVTSSIVILGYNRGGATHYLLPLQSALPVMLAAFLVALRRLSVPLFAIALAGVLGSNLAANAAAGGILDARKLSRHREQAATDAELFRFLGAEGLSRVYVFDFWEAYRLTFDAGERIVFAEPVPGYYPPYTEMVDAAERYAYVVRGPEAAEGLEAHLRTLGGGYRKREVAEYAVFDAFRPPVGLPLRTLSREGWRTTASHGAAEAARAVDGDPLTRWQTGPPQRPGTYYQVDLGGIHAVGQVALLPGVFALETPRAFRIETSDDGERWQVALALSSWWGLSWVGSRLKYDAGGTIQARLPPTRARWLRITLIRGSFGESETSAWSIGELFVSEPSPDQTASLRSPAADAFERGRRRAAEGSWAEALRAFQEAVDRAPEWEEAHVRLLAAYQRLGVDQEDFYERALTLERRGLPELAARAFWKAAQAFPHSHHSYPLLRQIPAGEAQGDPARVNEAGQRLASFVPAERVEASFGGKVRLLGYTLERRVVEPGGQVRLTYFWECLGEMETDYVVFVHLRGEAGALGDDHAPLEGLYPTSRWRKGEVIRDDRTVVIPETLRPGSLGVVVGVWDPRSGKRLRAEGAGPGLRGDQVEVARLVVTSASSRR